MKVNDLIPNPHSIEGILIRLIEKLNIALYNPARTKQLICRDIKYVLFEDLLMEDPETLLKELKAFFKSNNFMQFLLGQLFTKHFKLNNAMKTTTTLIENRNIAFELLFRIFHKFRRYYLVKKYPDIEIPTVEWYINEYSISADTSMKFSYPMTECITASFKQPDCEIYFPAMPMDSLDKENCEQLKTIYLHASNYLETVNFTSIYKLVSGRSEIVELCSSYMKKANPSFEDLFIERTIEQHTTVRNMINDYYVILNKLKLEAPIPIELNDKLTFEDSLIIMTKELLKYYEYMKSKMSLVKELHILSLEIFNIYLPYERDELNYVKSEYTRILDIEIV